MAVSGGKCPLSPPNATTAKDPQHTSTLFKALEHNTMSEAPLVDIRKITKRIQDALKNKKADPYVINYIPELSRHSGPWQWALQPAYDGTPSDWDVVEKCGLMDALLDLMELDHKHPVSTLVWRELPIVFTDALSRCHLASDDHNPILLLICRRLPDILGREWKYHGPQGTHTPAMCLLASLLTDCASYKTEMKRKLVEIGLLDMAITEWLNSDNTLPRWDVVHPSRSCHKAMCSFDSPETAIKRCLSKFHDGILFGAFEKYLDMADESTMHDLAATMGIISMIASLREVRPYATNSNVHNMLLARLWKEIRLKSKPSMERLAVQYAFNYLQNTILRTPALLLSNNGLLAMVDKGHLIDLLGRYVYLQAIETELDDTGHEFAVVVSKSIPSLYTEHSDLLLARTRAVWLQNYERLEDLDESKARAKMKSLDTWTRFGSTLGFEAPALRTAFQESMKVGRDSVGCSWAQCIYNAGVAPGAATVTMFLDATCGKVQYCSTYCQKQHWKAGHKAACRK